MPSTDKELVEILENRNYDGRYDQLIKNARAGDYHSYKSEVGGLPKLSLVWTLNNYPELKDVRRLVLDHHFDESMFDDQPEVKVTPQQAQLDGSRTEVKTDDLSQFPI